MKKNADNIAKTGPKFDREPGDRGTDSGYSEPGYPDSMGDMVDASGDEVLRPADTDAPIKHGFKFKNRLRAEFEAWWVPVEGETTEAIILARQRDPKPLNPGAAPAYMYICKLISPASVIRNGEKKAAIVPEGTTVAIRERKALEGLADLLSEHGPGRVAVQLVVGEKKRLSSGQSFWNIDVGYEVAP